MATSEKFYDKQPLAEVLLLEKEWDAAIKVAEQKGAYHTVLQTDVFTFRRRGPFHRSALATILTEIF